LTERPSEPGGPSGRAPGVVLVLFERLSTDHTRGFGFMGYRLARRLHEAGLLRAMVCLQKEAGVDIPSHLTHTLDESFSFKVLHRIIAWASRLLPFFNARLAEELLFDLFVCRKADMRAGELLFYSRPLFLNSIQRAQRAGMQVWVQASIPHPLANYALVRNEELRLGLPSRGAYSDATRAVRLARTIAAADKLVTMHPDIGKYAYDSYLEFLGPDKVVPLEHFFGVDPAGFAKAPAAATEAAGESEGPTFLHVSHMNLIKGIPYLLEAWERFKQEPESRGSRLLLVGQRDENLDSLIRQRYSKLPDLEMSGYVPDLLPYLARADVFVSPSISDNGPGTIAESMAAGMPVVSSTNCGFASLITEGEDGFTYRFNDVDRLVEILRWFAEHRSEIGDMGRNARTNIEHLSVDRYADELVGIFQAAARSPEHPPRA